MAKKENKFEITMTVYNDDTQYDTIKSSHGSFTELSTKSHVAQYCVDTCFVMAIFHIICLKTGI